MISFQKRTVVDHILRVISPAFRRKQDDELTAAIKELLDHPKLPCRIGAEFIPHGYGEIINLFGI